MVKVTDTGGRTFYVRELSIRTVTSEGESPEGRRFFLLYKSGRRREVDYASALRVFDSLQPKLFEDM